MRKMMCMAILMFGICCGICAQGTKKIVVVSDPHVMAPELLKSEGSAWTTYLAGQRKLVDYSVPLFNEMIERIKSAAPDLVLITGDLTKDGEQLSHAYVIEKLDELKVEGIPTLVIPGNHDRGANSNAVEYNGESTTPVDVADNAWFATEYANYGYGEGSEREETSLTYACEPIEGLVVIGIDSGTDGVVSSMTLAWVVEKATAARAKGKRVIAMMHHPLIPHFTGVDTFVSTAVVGNYETVRNTLADAGIRVVFTGHFHTSDIAKDWNGNLTKEIYDVNTGSLISYPCDYRVVTLSADLSELAIATEHIEELEAGDGFAETAKGRLKTAVKDGISAKGNAYKMIASTAADAFIIHAEGNEPANTSTATMLSSLEMAANMGAMIIGAEKAQALKDMANSMLQDKSQYGVEGREDVTNDLTLNIELPATIKLAADGYSTYCSENKLDITKSDGLTAYIVSGVTASTVVMRRVSVIPASTGFIVNGTGNALYDLYKSETAADDVSDNLLHGTTSPTAAPANTYVLSTKADQTGFFPAKTGITIPAHKAYLTVTGVSANGLLLDGVSGVSEVSGEKEGSRAFYNLNGQRVMNPTKGMYIVNGTKVVIK